MRLRTRFSVILLVVLIVGVGLSGIVLSQVLDQQAQDHVTTRGDILLGMVNSVRSYTSNHVRPVLADTLNTETEFTPARVPAFSARETFELMRQEPEYADFRFKEASLNPQNPRNRADEFEADLLAQFEADEGLSELTGFRTRGGEKVYYIARPLRVGSESCLTCHGDPQQAPASLITTYGDQNGFNWELDQIIAAQVLYVPAQTVFDDAQQSLVLMLGIFVVIVVTIILLLNFWLQPTVIRPVTQVAGIAEKISAGSLDAPSCASQDLSGVAERPDEIGQLARVFQTMCQEVYAREQALRQQLRELRIEIDQVKQARQVAEITDTDYFQTLQAKAKDIRRRRDDERGDAGETPS